MINRKILAVNEVVLLDCKRLNDRFISEAIKEWDCEGEGKFHKWIMVKVVNKWLEMIKKN